MILSSCNQFVAIPFSHNTALCCTIATELLYSSVQCDRCVNRRSVITPVCSAATFMDRPAVQSVDIH